MAKKTLSDLPSILGSFPKGSTYAGYGERPVTAARPNPLTASRTVATSPRAQVPVKPIQEPRDTRKQRKVEDADPFGNYYFALEVDGVEVAHFLECTGLKSSNTPYEIVEGGYNGNVHRRPGQSKWDNLVLKYASSASTYLLEWRDQYLQEDSFAKRRKRTGSVALMSNAGEVLRRFHFSEAWPVSWEGPALNAGGSALAVETLEIAHGGLSVDDHAWTFDEPV
jgi:phage tail-like protein